MRHAGLALLSLLAAASPVCAATSAADTTYDAAFVDSFAKACVPQRLSYEGTKAQAIAEGWVPVADDADPELAEMMLRARAEASDPEFPGWTTDMQAYAGSIAGQKAHLVVTYLVAPEVINFIGCYLYDFGMERMIDPALVTELIGNPISNSIDDQGLTGYSWGPPPAMPRTFDTYLTLIRSESVHFTQTGFSGLLLKFETSEPEAE